MSAVPQLSGLLSRAGASAVPSRCFELCRPGRVPWSSSLLRCHRPVPVHVGGAVVVFGLPGRGRAGRRAHLPPGVCGLSGS